MNQNIKTSEIYLAYQALIASKKIAEDVAQLKAIEKLSELAEEIEAQEKEKNGLLCKIFGSSKLGTKDFLKGLYIYGDVGRGKSMLMDLFIKNLQTNFKKRRIHFHSFMKEVHDRIHHWRENHDKAKKSDVIKNVVEEIAEGAQILCFDEMQINDIADAMIIGRVFEGLFLQNVVVIATSNRHPDELYKNGLQRDRFLPFIEMFKRNMAVFKLESPNDYRMRGISALKKLYFMPLGKEADEFAERAFTELTGAITGGSTEILVKGRKIFVEKFAGDTAQFDFKDLCDKPLGSEDFLEITKEFKTIILTNIPRLKKDDYNLAIRFIHLIDAMYESRTKLICTAEVYPKEIYTEGERSFEFERTVSRLTEMQSEGYLYLTPVI
jgi:cell division protein ZapE